MRQTTFSGKGKVHKVPRLRSIPFVFIPTLKEQTAALNKGGKLFPYNNLDAIARALRDACLGHKLPHYIPRDLRRLQHVIGNVNCTLRRT